ncbi:MAG: hypothetical protein AB1762_11975, partial [Gemmatimonadota bacterium]
MNAIVSQARTAWQVAQAEPALLVFGALIGVAVLLVLVLLSLPAKKAGAAKEAHPRPRLVHDLARSGKSTVEIARRTGLARDAVALAVAVSADAKRQSRPRSARTA